MNVSAFPRLECLTKHMHTAQRIAGADLCDSWKPSN